MRFYLKLVWVFFIFIQTLSLKAQLQVGDTVPDFTVTDAYGTTHNLYTYLNQGKHVLLKMGWIGCFTCDASKPAFNNVYYNFGCNQKDLICLEFDIAYGDTVVSSMSKFTAEYFAMGSPLLGTFAADDSNLLFPKAPFITLDGGSLDVINQYSPNGFTYEVIIEPTNKTILGHSEGGIIDPNTGAGIPLPGWPTYFIGMIAEADNPPCAIPGYSLTSGIEVQLPNMFHHVPSSFFAQYQTSVPELNTQPITVIPYQSFCQSTVSGCDTLKPHFTGYTVSGGNDTVRSVTLNWTSPNASLCNQYEIQYSPEFSQINPNQVINSSSNTVTVDNLLPGSYFFYVKCACNPNYQYDMIRVIIEPDTIFTDNSCGGICDYKLLIYEDALKSVGQLALGSWLNSDIKLRVTSNGNSEYFLLGSDTEPYLDTVDGYLSNARYYNLKVCSGSSLQLRLYEMGIGAGLGTAGFRLWDNAGNLLTQYYSPDSFPPSFPGFTDFNTLVKCSSTNGITQTLNHEIKFEVYPNPSNGLFSLSIQNPKLQPLALNIYDIYGRKIWVKNLQPADIMTESVDISNQATGMYLIELQTNTTSIIRKVMIE